MTANAQRNVKLGADIDTGPLTSGIGLLDTLTVKGQKQLDLNGHTLRLFTQKDALGNLIKIENSSLTLSDNSTAKTGRILGVTSTDSNVLISVWQKGKFTMNGGKLEVEAGKFRDVLWRRTIDCRYGGEVVINGGTLYVPPETYERYENQLFEQFLDEFDDLRNGSCGYTLIADNECKVTITGGTFQGPVRMNASNSKWNGTTSRVIITGGTFENNVVLNGAGSKAGDGKVTLAEIKGGTFLGKVQAWAAASFDSSFSTPEVVISGGDFSKEFWLRPKFPLVNDKEQEGMAYQVAAKLDGGTFHEGFSADKDSENYVYSASAVKQRLNASEIYQLADKLLGQSAIQTGNGTFAAQDYSSYNKYITNYRKSEHDSGGYAFIIKAVNGQPTTIIPNAWGMKSVTLDTNVIDYAKDWKGTAENLTNDKAHTLKFEWNPLAQELKDAGYSYRAECDRYISGSTTPTTDTISATDTERSYTIDKGADPKVYSFALHLNLKKGDSNVGIFSNEHIVKLVVNQAAPVEPVPTLAGKVYYTSGIVYGSPISIAASVTPAEATPAYQWQRSLDSGSTWENISGATSSRYTPVAADMGDTVRIRVKITANGYLGEIVGAALKVSKAANDDAPTWPDVVAQKDDSDAYTKFEITNYNPKQEYVYTDSPATGNGWPTGGKEIDSSTVTGLTEGKTYYIYTRFKATDTQTAGSKIRSSSVLVDEINRLNQIILTDENNKVYTSYGSGNTIYIKKGESLTLTATKNPDGANTWNSFKFKPKGFATSSHFTVIAPTDPVASGTIPSVTIRGDEAGTDTLAAEYSGYTPQYYGTWTVHVYENVSDIGTDAEITVSPSFPDMTMYQGETMPLPEYTVDVYPEGALDNYNLAWRIVKVGSGGASYKTSDDNITLENDEIKATKKHTGSENTIIALVAINKGNNYISSLSSFYVTVTEAPTVELTDVIVAPTKVNLDIGKKITLSAVKQPANAPGELKWESSNTGVATVDNNTGEVTAVAKGEATITVSCNGKSASCTVLVAHKHDFNGQPWLYMDPGNHYQECKAGDGYNIQAHEFTPWTDNGNGTHSRHCTVCKMTDGTDYTETASHTWQWVVDAPATPNAAGTQHEKCTGCPAKRSENTEIPMLTSIKVENLTVTKPVKDAAAAIATTTDSTYYVANTEWTAADGTTLAIGDKFQPGTVYTVKITLETTGAGVFSVKSTYNDIEGKAATVSPNLTGNDYADSVELTYTFDATEGTYVPTKPVITTVALPDGKVGDAYNQTLAATGTNPITWGIEAGTLPDGLTLVGDTIKGTPSKAGDFKFTVKATNGGGSDTKELTIKVADAEAAKYHTVTVTSGGNGSASANPAKAVSGTKITLTAKADSGYHFKEWQVVKGGVTLANETSSTTTFIMPAAEVEIKAIFEKNSSTGGGGGGGVTTYAITVKSAKNGDVTTSHKSASKGTTVTLTVDPDKGYVLDTLTVLDGKDKEIKLTEKNGKFTFTMPASKVTVAATFKASAPTGKNPFIDVPAGSYYEDAVVWAVEKGITSGTSAVTFDPNGNCTRAQAVTFLWRAAGSPAPKTKVMPFTDVPSGSYYYDAVLWAMEQGITKGTSDTAFSPNASCTRAQIVTFLWRANGSPAVSGNSAFTDVAADAYYAAAVAWAEKNGVTGGIGNGLFGSGNNCTRAQIVTFLYRAMK